MIQEPWERLANKMFLLCQEFVSAGLAAQKVGHLTRPTNEQADPYLHAVGSDTDKDGVIRALTPKQFRLMKATPNKTDEDGSGKLSADEVAKALRDLKVDENDIKTVTDQIGDKQLRFEELKHLVIFSTSVAFRATQELSNAIWFF